MEDKRNEYVREKIKEKPKNKRKTASRLLLSLVCGLIFALAFCGLTALLLPRLLKARGISFAAETETEEETEHSYFPTEEETESTEEASETEEPAIAIEPGALTVEDYQNIESQLYAIGKSANASIVRITKVTSDTDWFNNSYETSGQGSGVLIAENTREYLILTENKLIRGADSIQVTFIEDTTVTATIKGVDQNTGLAVLSVLKSDLEDSTKNAIEIATLGSSSLVAQGDIVIALGSPLGSPYSILTGTITSKSNEITTADHNYSVFTTDIVSNDDGSGILINTDGEIIGVIMQDFSNESNEDTILAVAISQLTGVIDLLCQGEEVPYLGLSVSTVTSDIADLYDLPRGVYITEVAMDSPAMEAGLQTGDVITAIDDYTVSTVGTYSTKLMTYAPGDVVTIVVSRKGNNGYTSITYEVTVGSMQ